MIAGLIAWMVGRGLVGWVASLIVWGGIAALAIGAVAGARHWIGQPYYDKGVIAGKAEQSKVDAPQIRQLTHDRDEARLQRDRAQQFNEQLAKDVEAVRAEADAGRQTISRLTSIAQAARNAANQLRRELKAERDKGAAEMERLKDIATGKTPILDQAAEAERILDQLAVWREVTP
jgi:hypothetical protein